jgi:hypothetical protein
MAMTAHADSTLQNPLNSQFSSIPTFISGFLKVLVMIALPIITVYFVISGYMFVSAGGDTGKVSQARTNFYYTVMGAILILGAWVLATMIGGTVTQLTG